MFQWKRWRLSVTNLEIILFAVKIIFNQFSKLYYEKWKYKSLSSVWLFVTPWSPLGSSLHIILQARILEGVAISFSRESSWPIPQTRCLWKLLIITTAVITNLSYFLFSVPQEHHYFPQYQYQNLKVITVSHCPKQHQSINLPNSFLSL